MNDAETDKKEEGLLERIGEGAAKKSRADMQAALQDNGLSPAYAAGRLKALCEAKKTKAQYIPATDPTVVNGETVSDGEDGHWAEVTHEDNTTQLNALKELNEILDVKPEKTTKFNFDIEGEIAGMVLARMEKKGRIGEGDKTSDEETD